MSTSTAITKGDKRHAACTAIFGEQVCDDLAKSLGTMFNKTIAEAMEPIKEKLMDKPASGAEHYFKPRAACKAANPFIGASEVALAKEEERRKRLAAGVASYFGGPA